MLVKSVTTQVSALEPPMHIAMVTCSKRHIFELGPALLSLSTFAPNARVSVFADAVGQRALSRCSSVLNESLRLDLHPIEALGGPMLDFNASAGPNPRSQPSKFACASAKLMLQGAPPLRDAPFLLALDVDTVANEPLAALWQWASEIERAGAMWGLVQESGGAPPLTFGKELRDVMPAMAKRSECVRPPHSPSARH